MGESCSWIDGYHADLQSNEMLLLAKRQGAYFQYDIGFSKKARRRHIEGRKNAGMLF